MQIEILLGSEADNWITDESNREEWKQLYDHCPWGTVFQSEEFVLTWYGAYDSQWAPIIVFGRGNDGALSGLLTLAVSKHSGELAAAGSNQAEYQAWLARPQEGNLFIESALQQLSRHFPHTTLRFLFAPPATPLEWALNGHTWKKRCDVRPISRALMSTKAGGGFRQSLRKKSNKSRLNRLERMGEIRFERLTRPEELDAIFDEVMTHGDFRLGAIHGVEPHHDPLKKKFYLAMMAVPRLLHATVLRVGDRIASAHVGVYNKDQVLLGILVHAPSFAKHSPSKLHVLMLGEALAEEGVAAFDLTPGGEYKDRFATHHDVTHILTLYFSRTEQVKHKAQRTFITGAKYALRAARITPAQAEAALAQLRHKWSHIRVTSLPPKLLKVARARLWETKEMRIYTYDVELARQLSVPQMMNRDCLPDLLAYQPSEAWQPRFRMFLKHALSGLEAGAHIYSYVQDGRLVHYGWLIEREQKSFITEVGHDFYLPPDSAVLTNFYTHPAARGLGFYRQSLRQLLHDAALIPGTRHIFIAVLANNLSSRHVIEKVGFTYQFSFFTKIVGGRAKRWSNAPAEFTRPPENS
jgi:CelD/BcsL family acetyltransferase involved in cellulose biosynthesis/RimJ/RimL family protein N-acetyltransferase